MSTAHNTMATGKTKNTFVERAIEALLWNFRYVVVLTVIGLLISCLVIILIGLAEVINVTGEFITHFFEHGLHFEPIYSTVLLGVITAVDDFLLGVVLLIFGLGTYDLFISHIDPAESQSDLRPDWLVFGSIDELKSVLGKVILMIMAINFLKFVIRIEHSPEPLSMLYIGGGIALIALALKWGHEDGGHSEHAHDIARTTMESRMARKQGVPAPQGGDHGDSHGSGHH
ncbi:MAG: YqhA family protein [Chloroflexota bacterium]